MAFGGFLRRLRFGKDFPYRLYDRVAFLFRQIGPRHPLRRPADANRSPPFFIVGSGRSGNTLLRAILTGHPDLAIPPESYVLGAIIRDFRTLGFLPWPALLRMALSRFEFYPHFDSWRTDLREVHDEMVECPVEHRSLAAILDAVYRAWGRRHMPNARRWGDKTPMNVYHLPRIDAVFPTASYIHIVRDGRDVVASYLEAGFYRSAEEACERWLESLDLVHAFRQNLPRDRYLEVRYERLVDKPEAVTREVCEHLGVAFEQEMLRHRERVDDLGDTDAPHHAGLTRPIDDRSVGAWRQRLDPRQRGVVEGRLGTRLATLGYVG